MRRYNFPRLDIAKIDIEGAESIVFAVHKQAVRVQDWLPKVNMLTLEIHPWFAHHYFGQDKLFEKVRWCLFFRAVLSCLFNHRTTAHDGHRLAPVQRRHPLFAGF